MRPVTASIAATALLAVLATACSSPGGSDGEGEGGGDAVTVALITSTSGPLASYGEQYLQGFEAGLDHATGGTGEVEGVAIDVVRSDDAGEPSSGVSLARQRIDEGATIIAGTASSGVAVQVAPLAEQNEVLYITGPAATDSVTGINDFTFRSGRQTYQDVVTASEILAAGEGDLDGARVTVLAQDNAFGQANVTAVESVLTGQGLDVASVLVPPSATDLTPSAAQVLGQDPDLVFVAWAGDTAQTMWTTLDQQGVLDAATVVTGLDIRATYPVFGAARDKVTLLAHYVPGATDTPEARAMEEYFAEEGWEPDLFSPDGFTAAQMVVEAVRAGGAEGDTAAMVDALEGWSFSGVKGEQTVREGDHALLQPMFEARFEGEVPSVVRTLDPATVAPAEAAGE
ncbi:substrate-binding domain-containing protein [Streptomyces radicis]|uniref:Amino acid ABC transporter substrate-binding protein n=1 Tax=Streptomyces radicis TaxID=1750517 RepID=A0A3A9VZ84_9ACTN|nr:substrate-binding domain-containing protein [Streptomyces radicis]RKN06315.1 amino acid ABC transporter substrate-binding protein [Streptomyces radicis]RKN18645.1 amino acid ABC transporter substrate-binding protein [Streptomyces radicis]